MEETIQKQKVFKVNELKDLNLDNIEFDNPIYNENSYFIPINCNFYLQLENVKFDNFIEYNESVYLHLNITEYIENLTDFFLQLDNYLVNCVSDNFSTWFKKYISIETLLEFYIPISRDLENKNNYEKNKTYFPIVEVPYDSQENDVDILILNKDNLQIDEFRDISKVENSTVVLKLHGLNFEKKRFHAVWQLIQIKIY